jgi:hypothetical protein
VARTDFKVLPHISSCESEIVIESKRKFTFMDIAFKFT